MGCGCGSGGTPTGMVYKIVTPGEEPLYRETRGEAAVIRAQRGYTTTVMQVPRWEMERALAEQSGE